MTNILFTLAMASMIFFAGMLIANFLTQDITTFRTAMDCTNQTISDGSKVTCLVGDIVMPYFIWAIISLAGGVVIAKFLL